MAASFLDVALGLVHDEARKAAFARDPAAYLDEAGFGAFDPPEVAEAVRHVADALPVPLARPVLASLAETGSGPAALQSLVEADPSPPDTADPGALDDLHVPDPATSPDPGRQDADDAFGDEATSPDEAAVEDTFGAGTAEIPAAFEASEDQDAETADASAPDAGEPTDVLELPEVGPLEELDAPGPDTDTPDPEGPWDDPETLDL